MVVGVHGEHAVKRVVLEVRQEHEQTQYQHMEDLSVQDLQRNNATHKDVLLRFLVINLVLVCQMLTRSCHF